jgi:DNA-directed RNA polymerase specialized sigma24 family protein
LTPKELEILLSLLSPDREEAGIRYEILRKKLIRFFQSWGCDRPEELADTTFDRVMKKLGENTEIRATDSSSYFFGVARNVYLEYTRARQREQKMRESRELQPAPSPDPEPDERIDLLRECLDGLSEDERRLALEYHQGGDNILRRKELCRKAGIPTLNALRIRVHRIRRKLEECVESKRSN